jgi:4-hydroxybenzoate polyprenyltransferase
MTGTIMEDLHFNTLGTAVRLLVPHAPAWIWFDIVPTLAIAVVHTRHLPGMALIPAFVAIILADSAVSMLNDVFDVDTDRMSTEARKNGRPLATGLVTRRFAIVLSALLCVSSIALMSLMSITSAFFLAALLIMGIFYSMPPVRMSGRPILSQLFWVIFWITYYTMIVSIFSPGSYFQYLYFLFAIIFFLGIAETLAKDIRDIENDRDSGKQTTVVKYGVHLSLRYSLFFSILGGFFWVYSIWNVTGFLPGVIAVCLTLLIWHVFSASLTKRLLNGYDKYTALRLHVGFMRIFLILNLLTIFLIVYTA